MKSSSCVRTAFSFALPAFCLNFLSEIAHAAPRVGVKVDAFDGVLNAGPLVQALLILMIILSIISWGIIFAKYKQYATLRAANASFSDFFWKATSLEKIFERVEKNSAEDSQSSLARVFKAAYLELQRLAESPLAGSSGETQVRLSGLDNLERTVRKAVESEVANTESRLNFLATVGSTSPFVGLLGTVVGIMTSFGHIAASGSASLAVVAPGISEALFSTAVGLFAALPAVAAYNYYVSQVRRFEMDLNSFGADFLNIAKRNFFRDE